MVKEVDNANKVENHWSIELIAVDMAEFLNNPFINHVPHIPSADTRVL